MSDTLRHIHTREELGALASMWNNHALSNDLAAQALDLMNERDTMKAVVEAAVVFVHAGAGGLLGPRTDKLLETVEAYEKVMEEL